MNGATNRVPTIKFQSQLSEMKSQTTYSKSPLMTPQGCDISGFLQVSVVLARQTPGQFQGKWQSGETQKCYSQFVVHLLVAPFHSAAITAHGGMQYFTLMFTITYFYGCHQVVISCTLGDGGIFMILPKLYFEIPNTC